MKLLHFLLCLFIGSFAMAQGDKMNPEKISYTFTAGKTIQLLGNEKERSLYPEVKQGNMVVFNYTKRSAENPDITDDEQTESVLFEVAPSWNSFVFRKKLPMSKATYNLGCFCVERGYFNITGGYIKGKKLVNGNYLIEADATITFSTGVVKSIKFKGEFTPANAG
jgi:hypothetical protein